MGTQCIDVARSPGTSPGAPLRLMLTPAALALALALASSLASCTIAPSASGRPCANDGDCGGGHYCQLEVEPNVCLPGALGLPALPNFPPLIERAVVIVPIASGLGPV